MTNLVIQNWLQERIRLIEGLVTGLEAEAEKLPATQETIQHRLRVSQAEAAAEQYIRDLKEKPIEMYELAVKEIEDLQPGRLLVPHWPGYWSLPWQCEELPTLLHMLTMEAEALTLKASAEASLAKANWLLAQLALEFGQQEERQKNALEKSQ
ncbi:MAG: hypothetical protein SFV17_23140 [Candidatus Obscuribacter sp.]|jgi:hypothetical protein|nr:hypothetical protein [Candidatus Melainabacteria bacterium]MDX1989604.1 hypothetical protein [Candidatus Obscuribacter sp.]